MNRSGKVRRYPHFAVAAKRVASLVGLANVVLLAGCGNLMLHSTSAGPPTGGPPKPVQGGTVTITPQYIALRPGGKFQFAAKSSSGGSIAWSVSGGSGG